MLPMLLLTLLTTGVLCVAPGVHARKMTPHQMKAKQLEAAKRWHTEGAVKRASGSGVQNITFSNPEASSKFGLR
jgi:carboxypeptidase D